MQRNTQWPTGFRGGTAIPQYLTHIFRRLECNAMASESMAQAARWALGDLDFEADLFWGISIWFHVV